MDRNELFKIIKNDLTSNPDSTAREISKRINADKTSINKILYCKEYKDAFTSENYRWRVKKDATGSCGYIFFTDPDDLPKIKIYLDRDDTGEEIKTIKTAMLSMRMPEYVGLEIKVGVKTGNYYILKTEWDEYQKYLGNLLAHVELCERSAKACYEKNARLSMSKSIADLNQFSQLMLHGYNVSGADMTMAVRRDILMNCIFFKLMKQSEVIGHLESFIKFGGKKTKAIDKWNDDLKFVRNYQINITDPKYSKYEARYDRWKNEADELEKDFCKKHKLTDDTLPKPPRHNT